MCTSVNESVESHNRAIAMSGTREPARETAADLRQACDAEDREVILGWCLVQIVLFVIFYLLIG
jgi:methylmalonyl-CoA mutase cobalamin-binding subunit